MDWKVIEKHKNTWLRGAERFVFPFVLLLYPLLGANQGIDVSDPIYSLTNFRFFPELSGTWALATWLANVAGYFLTKLPFGGTLLGMNIYTRLLVSLMALLSYYFLKGKMPAWAAFLGEIIAISFCWCPTTILYNYLTYFFFLLGCILLYRGLIWERKGLMIAAGICLGLNVMVRTPNITEALLIVAVFYYGRLTGRSWGRIWQETGWCVLGFLVGFLACLGVISLQYGPGAYFGMFSSLAGYSSTDASYSPFSMLTSIAAAYGHTLVWVMVLLVCALAGGIGFQFLPKGLHKAGKAVYCLCILVLLRLFWGRGMFTFTYYNYRSIYEWGMLLLYLTLASCVLALANSRYFKRDRLLALIVLLSVIVTPIGSNNDTMPNLNNLFLAAPFTLWTLTRVFAGQRRKAEAFPAMALAVMVVAAVMVQGIGFKAHFAFGDGIYGEKRDAKVENSAILKGMRTRAENGEALTGLIAFLDGINESNGKYENGGSDNGGFSDSDVLEKKTLLTLGNAPGLHFILDMPLALTHGWPDLDTYPAKQMQEELAALCASGERPLVILYKEAGGFLEKKGLTADGLLALGAEGGVPGMEGDADDGLSALKAEAGTSGTDGEERPLTAKEWKWICLARFLQAEGYSLCYENSGYLVFR